MNAWLQKLIALYADPEQPLPRPLRWVVARSELLRRGYEEERNRAREITRWAEHCRGQCPAPDQLTRRIMQAVDRLPVAEVREPASFRLPAWAGVAASLMLLLGIVYLGIRPMPVPDWQHTHLWSPCGCPSRMRLTATRSLPSSKPKSLPMQLTNYALRKPSRII